MAQLIKRIATFSINSILGMLVASFLLDSPSHALTINRRFLPAGTSVPAPIPGLFTGESAANVAGGGSLVDIFNTAADFWESAIKDDVTIDIFYGWIDLSSFFGDAAAVGATFDDSFPPKVGAVGFNSANSVSWFLDSTPHENSEYQKFTATKQDLGAGSINVGRVYTDPIDIAADRFDLLTTAIHEIGHSLGFITAFPNFGIPGNPALTSNLLITNPRPFAGTLIPVSIDNDDNDNAHIDIPSALMSTGESAIITGGRRKLPSTVDILSLAQVNGFTQLNFSPSRSTPEPSFVLGIVIVTGLGGLLKRRKEIR